MTTTTLKNIILFSSDNTLANIVAFYVKETFGHDIASVEALQDASASQHMVTVVSSEDDLSALQKLGMVVDVDRYIPDTIENLGDRIFDDACDYFLGELSTDELLACA